MSVQACLYIDEMHIRYKINCHVSFHIHMTYVYTVSMAGAQVLLTRTAQCAIVSRAG